MSCQHCASKVSKLLGEQPYIETYELDLESGRASLKLKKDEEPDLEQLISKIQSLGCKVQTVT